MYYIWILSMKTEKEVYPLKIQNDMITESEVAQAMDQIITADIFVDRLVQKKELGL